MVCEYLERENFARYQARAEAAKRTSLRPSHPKLKNPNTQTHQTQRLKYNTNPKATQTKLATQNMITTFVSFQPSCSK